ncbi:MAG: tetratricopeptide repeat protein [Cyclobacteriaceae bacterium]|nr:tetratricopeptide repeat protein [Cyclobacteriaceae bacterium]
MRYCIILFLLFTGWSAMGQNRKLDSLQKIIDNRTRDTVELQARINLIYELLRREPLQAKFVGLQTAKLADSLKQPRWLISTYTYLVEFYREVGQVDSGLYYLAKTENLAKENPDNVRMQFNFLRAAGLFYKDLGEYNKALPYAKASLEMWKKEDETRAGQFLNIGNLYYLMGDFQNAADHHLQSLRLFEKLKNTRGQAYCLHSIGNDFFSLNQLTEAEKYYKRSLQIKEQLGDKRGVLTTTISLGDVYKGLNAFEKAETLYQDGLTAARNLKLPREEARALHQSGLLYRRMKEIERARDSFGKSMAISKQMGDSVMFVKTQSELINLDLVEQNQKKTEARMLDGLNTLIRTGDRRLEAVEYHRLSEYYTLNKDFEKALYYLKKHEALTDSVEGNAVLLQLKDLEEKYNSEKKEQEIALLKKDHELQTAELQRERANKIIVIIALISVIIIATLLINRYRISNRTKRMLEMERMRNDIARDLHDDIGSTLSSINIISQLALKNANGSTPHFQRIAQHSSRLMESMSDIVWSINPNNDSLERVVAKMKEFASEILDPLDIAYSFQGEETLHALTLNVSQRKNLFLIFKEALNNAAKYSGASSINIGFAFRENQLRVKVMDNGKGFDATLASSGNGLTNMKIRAESIRGRLLVTSTQQGTTIQLAVPLT